TPMFWSWLAAIALIFLVGLYVGSETVSFLGIAESREININFERAVEIKTIHVQRGQRVAKGEILLELSQTEIESQIRTLQAQLGKIVAELKLREKLSRIVSKKKVETNVVDPLTVERAQVLKEIGVLENQKRGLFVFAEIDGIVGAVNFKAGEKAPAFASLITISPVNPTYVIGYVHESAHSRLEQGQKVLIVSPASGREMKGEVMTIGARIIEIPTRLLRISTITSWGREVLIKLPEENGFLLSEKVQVKPTLSFDFMPTAEANPVRHASNEELDIKLPYEISVGENFEPSGLIWADDLSNFILVSDEAVQTGAPNLLMMNAQGQVSRQVLTIDEAAAIDDMESISSDGTHLYVMASHSNTRKGKRTLERETFVKVERQGLRLKAAAQVNMRTLLEDAFSRSTDARLAALGSAVALGDFDIEGHSVDAGDLYVALKSPQTQRNHGVVLRIKDLDAVFKTGAVSPADVSIYADIDLTTRKHQEMQISDLYVKNGKAFVATTCKGSSCSAVWSFSPIVGVSPVQLAYFGTDQVEGISYDPKANVLTGIFDAGGKPTKIVKIQLK
ncbi:MAG: efflux RND transporter periplasmic adaptor subunit, partial [Bdellovibrionota bacterium]